MPPALGQAHCRPASSVLPCSARRPHICARQTVASPVDFGNSLQRKRRDETAFHSREPRDVPQDCTLHHSFEVAALELEPRSRSPQPQHEVPAILGRRNSGPSLMSKMCGSTRACLNTSQPSCARQPTVTASSLHSGQVYRSRSLSPGHYRMILFFEALDKFMPGIALSTCRFWILASCMEVVTSSSNGISAVPGRGSAHCGQGDHIVGSHGSSCSKMSAVVAGALVRSFRPFGEQRPGALVALDTHYSAAVLKAAPHPCLPPKSHITASSSAMSCCVASGGVTAGKQESSAAIFAARGRLP